MKPTIRDVAKYAGVSVATVSRYLNNSPLIAEASIQKVKGAIEALNYQPSMMARGLLHGNTKTIALAVDYSNAETYGNDYFLRIQYGLENELTRNGYFLMICHIGKGKRGVSTLESIINENRIDGLVLLSELAQPAVLELLEASELPYVIAGRPVVSGAHWVDIDNVAAGRMATEKLLRTGAREIGFVANSFDKVFVAERRAGYEQAMRGAGLPINTANMIDRLDTPAKMEAYVSQIQHNPCEAYVASDSTIAFYLLRALSKHKIRVPDLVQVVGFDDSTLAEAADPAMTVVGIDVVALGAAAAKMLMKQLQADQTAPVQHLLPVSMIERRSTK